MSSSPLPILRGRFARLARRSNEIWQGGVVSLPVWLVDDDDPHATPARPRAVVWVSQRTGLSHVSEIEDGVDATTEDVLRALFTFAVDDARELEGRPATIEVTDAALRDALHAALTELDTTVALVDALPLVDELLRDDEIEEYGDFRPNLLDVPGMTIERMRAFADAASRFIQSQPWGRFPDDELIVVEGPASAPGMQHLIVTGSSSPPLGLTFFASRNEFERLLELDEEEEEDEEAGLRRAYVLTFGRIDSVSFGDADDWVEHGLAVANPAAYPFAAEMDPDEGMRRPTPRELAHLEALLRMLAASSDDEIDRGRWQQTVDTVDGPVTMTLSLPALLEATAGPSPMTRPADPTAALARAQQLMDEAGDAGGRLPITRARQALALSEDCVDAWLTLFEACATDEEALDFGQKAIAAAARVVGPERFETLAGRFRTTPETSAYLEAQLEVAHFLRAIPRTGDAIEAYREIVRLDAEDVDGVRYLLAPLLIEIGRDAEALALLDAYPDEPHPIAAYARALVLFRQDPGASVARDALADAIRANRHAASFLIDPDSTPERSGELVAPGSKDEAVEVSLSLARVFDATPGAIDWLRASIPRPARQRRGGARRRR
jgi:tetratricopeptide (TPR) repeat protein